MLLPDWTGATFPPVLVAGAGTGSLGGWYRKIGSSSPGCSSMVTLLADDLGAFAGRVEYSSSEELWSDMIGHPSSPLLLSSLHFGVPAVLLPTGEKFPFAS